MNTVDTNVQVRFFVTFPNEDQATIQQRQVTRPEAT